MSPNLHEILSRARCNQARLERYAARRERFLEALDWNAMTNAFAFVTSMDDEALNWELANAFLYVEHIEALVCTAVDCFDMKI